VAAPRLQRLPRVGRGLSPHSRARLHLPRPKHPLARTRTPFSSLPEPRSSSSTSP
jgi:hypothetical protein